MITTVRERAIGILTEDPALYGELALFLKEKRIPLVSLILGKKIPRRVAVVVTSAEEKRVVNFRPKVVARPGRMLETWTALQMALDEPDGSHELIVGVDPGPRPGYAIVGPEGRCIAKGVAETPESVASIGLNLKQTLPGTDIRFRVGNGDPLRQCRIVNALLQLEAPIELVDERRTTLHGRRDNDPLSALAIAFTPGARVNKRLNHHITKGEVGDLQRMSRERSGGRYTIPRDLASAVLEGRLSMNEAIEETGKGKRLQGARLH
jgi:hypothetical protein